MVGICWVIAALACGRRLSEAKHPPASRPATKAASVDVQEPIPPPALEPRSPPHDVVELPVCLFGCPVSERAPTGRLIQREGWVLFNDPKTKFADWVAYRVSPSTIGRSIPRDWKADPDLPPEETLEPEDFRQAHATLHTDRGHQAPLASFSGVRDPEPLNYMSNVTPQRSLLNQKLWNVVEQKERELVLDRSVALFVVTGPLYERAMKPLPGADEEHVVPSGYFKVMALELDGTIDTGALIVDQEDGRDGYCAHQVTIDEVERRARMDLFRLLPDVREVELERDKGTLFSRLGCSN